MFKYTDINGARFIIRDKTLKFSCPDHFNDPFEFYDELVEFDITKSYFKKILEKRIEDRNRIKMHMKIFDADKSYFIAELIRQFKIRKNSTRISCFSNINQNILMWSHYAKNHTGVCIEFNEEILKRTYTGDSVIEPVRYRRKIKSLNFSKYQEKAIFHWILTKSKDWEYEKEKRIILGSDPVEFQSFPENAILKVTFGCKTEKEDLQEIIEIIKTKKLDWIQLSQMRMDKKSYRLIECSL